MTKGRYLDEVTVECCLWGDLSKPLVVLMGGISASRMALDTFEQGAGWWRDVVNQDTALNFKNYSYLTFDYFSFAEHIENPQTITTAEQATILKGIQGELNLPQFHAVIGSSYGGMVALAFAALFPNALKQLICIAAADRNSVKTQAIRFIQREIIALGRKNIGSNDPSQYLALARALAVVGYRGEEEFEQRFQSDLQGKALKSVASYLNHQGDKFTQQFSASRYLQLSESIDQHQVDVSTITVPTHLIAFSSDQMVPLSFVEELKEKLKRNCQLTVIDSLYGHDGFLLETEQLNQIFNGIFNSTNYEQNHDNIKPNHRCASGY